MPGGAAVADATVATGFVSDLRAWEADHAAVLADQTVRFPDAHEHGIENHLNARRGYCPRPDHH